ncbi:MAG: cardiolipin synthase [Clostridia bacterium]|nr:cardiolipin synthase [Clostridia bacterium]
MRSRQKENLRRGMGRMAFVGISILLQVLWLLGLIWRLNGLSVLFAVGAEVLALLLAVRIYSKPQNAAVKTSWIILLMVSPVLGICLYALCGRSGANWLMRRRFQAVQEPLADKLPQDPAVKEALEAADRSAANQAHYLRSCGYPVYGNTDVEYYSTAEEGIAAQKEALRKAEHFIFMEYHAIEDSVSFQEIKEILAEKARQGVEVRLFYDDMGSIGFINSAFVRRMRALGIQCRVFNPLLPVINVFMNNRDHRKITVVDGKVGFTGGYNLADEYFNLVQPYGQWKDTGLKLTGDAVRSLTVMFLEMWNAMEHGDSDYNTYLFPQPYAARETGFVLPYADSPLDNERVGEYVYMNIIKNAQHRLYVMTPYLILDDEMTLELSLAARRGVDVRIITPGIPDKKLVYKVTRSYYAALVKNGVRVFEYSPGFLHAKMMLCDDHTAAVGTINLDYRSLYLHFENSVWLYKCSAIRAIAADFADTFPQCREVTEKYRARSGPMRFGQCLLRLFAPLM